MQAEIEKITCEYANGGIAAVVRGDFSLVSIKISPEALKEAMASGRPSLVDVTTAHIPHFGLMSF